MVTSLLEHERIKTTVPKAKEVRRFAEKMITHAKKGQHPQVMLKLLKHSHTQETQHTTDSPLPTCAPRKSLANYSMS